MRWVVGLFLFIVSFIVIDLIVEGAISDAFAGVVDEVIGGPISILFKAVLFIVGLIGLVAFLGALADRIK